MGLERWRGKKDVSMYIRGGDERGNGGRAGENVCAYI